MLYKLSCTPLIHKARLHFFCAKIGIVSLCSLFVPTSHFAQKANNYGLHIIDDYSAYRNLPLSSRHKLAWIDSVLHPYHREVVYQTKDNFTKQVLYDSSHRFYLIKEAADALKQVQDSLVKRGFNILVFDAYRPYSVTQKMWEIVPDDRYAANPAKGSMHNRGLAIDLSLADLQTGQPAEMPTGFDDFTPKAWIDFTDLAPAVLQNRELLQGVMKHYGFRPITTEWWHFYWPYASECPLLDISFEELK